MASRVVEALQAEDLDFFARHAVTERGLEAWADDHTRLRLEYDDLEKGYGPSERATRWRKGLVESAQQIMKRLRSSSVVFEDASHEFVHYWRRSEIPVPALYIHLRLDGARATVRVPVALRRTGWAFGGWISLFFHEHEQRDASAD